MSISNFSAIRSLVIAMLCLGLASIAGCGSFESSSDIVTSPFKSSSDSSGGGTAYRQDVRALTLAYLDSSEDAEGFLRGLSQVADEHGIVDWEGIPATFLAFGHALRSEGVPLSAAQAHGRTLFGVNGPAEDWIREAYRS